MLPYTAEALFALYARYLQELWPAALALFALTLSVLRLAWYAGPNAGRIAGGLLALGWFWVGAVFHLTYFATLNFAAPLYAGLFILQGLLLVWYGPVNNRITLRLRADSAGGIGACLVLYAVIAYPLIDTLSGFPVDRPRLAGLAPGPTALLTFGVLLHSARRIPLHLLVVPLLWSLVAGFGGWVLGIPADLAPPLLVTLGLFAAIRDNRRRAPNHRDGA